MQTQANNCAKEKLENIVIHNEPEMNLTAVCPSRCSPCQSAYCKGELVVGIIILDSILLIKGSAHRHRKNK